MIVVESSAMVDALVDRPVNPELLALLADEELHAPALLDFEVAGALRGHVLDLRDNLTAYDAAYVVLAQALDAPLSPPTPS